MSGPRVTGGAKALQTAGGKRTTRMALWSLWISGFLIAALPHVYSQLTWTPIYVSSKSQVDLWTQSDTGCPCSFNSSSKDCACCVPSGGCSCGASMPHRCVQCGLERHCANMCNITLDSKELITKSNRGFGQIKSPSLEGPTVCTYKFIPDEFQRVELQIYRLVSVGLHNGKACEGGWLQLEGGARVCGRNERFQQPVVLFSDKPVATLYMQVTENTTRSQFLAYFSFASKTSTAVGWPVKSGKPVNNTECDWVYEDCLHKDCILASPGYPGLYPPNARCRYFITTETSVTITITFTSVLLSYNRCTNDYIAVYTGPTTSSTLLKMMCGTEKSTVVHTGSMLLVEFKSGAEVPPYDYNGFLARVSFTEITTEAPTTLPPPSTFEMNKSTSIEMSNSIRYNNRDLNDPRKDEGLPSGISSCDLEVSGERVRSGHHDTRGKLKSTTCRFLLRGRTYDTVHVVLASYNLSAPECKSNIEIWDGIVDSGTPISNNVVLSKKYCSPGESTLQRNKLSAKGDKHVEPERHSSSGRDMTVVLRRATNSPPDEEFMDVSYYFHDERHDGTQQPTRACDVEYHGLSSPNEGWVMHPAHRLFAREGPVKCKQHFIPGPNQSVIVTVENGTRQLTNSPCSTYCGDRGCDCVSSKTMDEEDHLQLVSETGHVVSCLCGNYQNWLPLKLRSWTPMYIEWSRSSRSSNGLNFQAAFKFTEDSYCGYHNTTRPEGIVNMADLANGTSDLKSYYQQKCTWILDSETDRQLTIEVASMQDRPCTAWNLTIHEYKKAGDPVGQRLHTFCSRDRHKIFTLPWKMNTAVVRLQALGRTAPQYSMKWRSDTVIANTHKSGPSPAPNFVSESSAKRCAIHHPVLPLLTVLMIVVASSIDFSTRPQQPSLLL